MLYESEVARLRRKLIYRLDYRCYLGILFKLARQYPFLMILILLAFYTSRLPAAGITPALPNGTLPIAASNWIGRGQASATQNGNTLIVNQASNQAILNWQSFNISNDSHVNFVQPGSSAQVLNRIADQNPTIIQGTLQANGRVYLINQNGIVFGQGAQVNVGSLVASSLDVSDDIFLNGILTAKDQSLSAFSGLNGFIRIEPGVNLSTLGGGQIWMFAPSIENNGLIHTPDGQTLLAAGKKIYLSSSADPAMRGVAVEVSAGGSVTNLGQVLAERGNITLAGLAVNQLGRLNATTTVARNGSIWLQALEKPSAETGTSNAGTVTLGAGSITEILPEIASKDTSTAAQIYLKSLLQSSGHVINMQTDALIHVPSGDVIFDSTGATNSNRAARIYIDQGARIDVAGLNVADRPMSENFLQLRLTTNELADSALQKSGVLLGKTVTVDVREGTPLADISSAVAQIGHTVAERSTVGGTINMKSSGDVILRDGSILDVSGGSLSYKSGWGNVSQLLTANGGIVGIGQASADQLYLGVAGQMTVTHSKWGVTESFVSNNLRFNPAYTEGRDAGTISISSAASVLDGSQVAHRTIGTFQRSIGTVPMGGKLVLSQTSDDIDYKSALELTANASLLDKDFTIDSALPDKRKKFLTVNATQFQKEGFTRLEAASAGDITINADVKLDLGLGGSLNLKQGSGYVGNVLLAGQISAPGGSVNVISSGNTELGDIIFSGKIDVAGFWTNDNSSLHQRTLAEVITVGGNVNLQAARGLDMKMGSVIDVSGGAWNNVNNKLSAGKAGVITLVSSRGKEGSTNNQSDGAMNLNGSLFGFGLSQGATLSLRSDGFNFGSTSSVLVKDSLSSSDTNLPISFFSQGGFSTYNLVAWDRQSILQDILSPVLRNWILPDNFKFIASSKHFSEIANTQVLPDYQRQAVNLTLPISTIRKDAAIISDNGGTITVNGFSHLLVDGLIQTHGGVINLNLAGKLPDSQDVTDFDSSQALWLGSNARLDTSGKAVVALDKLGHRNGIVKVGGNINLSATNSYIVSEPGSVMDVSGSGAAYLDLPRQTNDGTLYTSAKVTSNAGNITLNSNTGMLLAGKLVGNVSSVNNQGGTLNVNLLPASDNTLTATRSLQLQDSLAELPTDLTYGIPIDNNSWLGRTTISNKSIEAGGFDVVNLKSWDQIRWNNTNSLTTRRAISLDTPNLMAESSANLQLFSTYINLGNSDGQRQTAVNLTNIGTAKLNVQAQTIDLVGNVSTQGVGVTELLASGDIRLQGVLDSTVEHNAINTTTKNALIGSYTTAGSLYLKTNQVTPTTLSQFTFNTSNESGLILKGNGNKTTSPMSAGGSLIINAPNIGIDSVLSAPFGKINLNATHNLTVESGGLVSVSGKGLQVPYGYTETELSWYYGLDSTLGDTTRIAMTTPAFKAISLSAENVNLKSGSTIDVSGGGDLMAWEWQKGAGGSTDILAKPGTFAIVPSLGSTSVPRDWQSTQNTTLMTGDAVYLSGVADLPAGIYTLLPAHYALLPGAYAISQVSNGMTDILPTQNVVRPDGSLLIAGKRVVSGTSITDERSSGFILQSGALVRRFSQFVETSANNFFSNGQPINAGHVSLAATQSLVLDGKLDLDTAGGMRGDVDISAPQIAVISTQPTSTKSNVLQLNSDTLSSWKARSLLLGGTRSELNNDGEQTINVGADSITIANDVAHPLLAQDVILVATDNISLATKSVIKIQDFGNSNVAASSLGINGSGTFLRASSESVAEIKRTGVVLPTTNGTLRLEPESTVLGASVLNMDATYNITLSESSQIKSPILKFSSSQINLGAISSEMSGLNLGGSVLADLGHGSDSLSLKAYKSLNLFGDFDLGLIKINDKPLLSKLILDTPIIESHGGTANFRAQSVMFTNTGNVASSDIKSGAGVLNVESGGDIQIGSGHILFQGLASTNLSAVNDVIFSEAGSQKVSGDLQLKAARVTAKNGADQSLQSLGNVEIDPNNNTAGALQSNQNGLGSHLSISGSHLNNNGLIDLTAGSLDLIADKDLNFSAGSVTRSVGFDKAFFDVIESAPAGTINLISKQGNVNLAANSLIDVSGSVNGGAAGTLNLNTPMGSLYLNDQARLKGSSNGTGISGIFSIDSDQIGSLITLNNVLNSGGFLAERNVRARSGNLIIGADQTWRANRLSFTADKGQLIVAGRILASGIEGGHINLWAGDGFQLTDGASLQAIGQNSDKATINIGNTSSTHMMSLAEGSIIDVASNDEKGTDGTVNLRVVRTGFGIEQTGGTEIAMDMIGSHIHGASTVSIEAVQTYTDIKSIGNTNNTTNLTQSKVQNDISKFMSGADTILERLGVNGQSVFHLTPGVEVQSTDSLLLSSDWNLFSSNRIGGEAGTLTLRSASDLILNSNLSDGFSNISNIATLQGGPSWSYRLVGGADLNSANPLSVVTGNGKVQIAAGKVVRTGTGSIKVSAGSDVIFSSNTSALYTAGTPAASLVNFKTPNNAEYSEHGGDLDIFSQGNIIGLTASTQDTSNWLYRFGTGAGSSSWWVSYKDFAQNIGVLGGGNLTLNAGGNIQDISASIATNGRLAGDAVDPIVLGGGNLKISAEGNISGGVFTEMKGNAQILSKSTISTGSLGLAPILGLGNGSVSVIASRGLTLDGTFNPTLMTPGNNGVQGRNNSYFSTYADNSDISVISLSGDATLNNNALLAYTKFKHSSIGQSSSWSQFQKQVYTWYPGKVSAVALQGNVSVNSLTLLPAAQGGLNLLADGSVTVQNTITESGINPLTELASTQHPAGLFNLLADGITPSTQNLLHIDDTDPIRLYAVKGSVVGPSTNQLGNFVEPVVIRAGQDIVNAGVTAQNMKNSDISVFEAGRDVLFTSPLDPSGGLATNNLGVTIAGAGTFEINAGRNLDLGSSTGIVSNGNLQNASLPDQGARVVLSVGLGRDATGAVRLPAIHNFIATYVAAEGIQASKYRQDLQMYMADMGQPGLTVTEALQAFFQLTLQQQLPFSAKVLYAELQASGRAEAVSHNTSDYQRGNKAISVLFPSSDYRGDLRLYLSQVKTQRGGDVNLLVPGGAVNEGLANPPSGLSKVASELGIVTVKGGNVQSLVDKDFLVNQSRVFTLAGGDILIWSENGSIDAGRGAKTTAYAPLPTLVTKSDGTVEYDNSASASGSGIGVLVTDPTISAGNVDLIAPRGTVNAGEAGIRSQGNLFIAALNIRGADNIATQGQVVGVPVTTAPAAGLTSLRSNTDVANAMQSTLDAWQADAEKRNGALSTFTVEVIGYGP